MGALKIPAPSQYLYWVDEQRVFAEMKAIINAAQLLLCANRVLISTGAGMSAESGIPTYRGPDGQWRDFTAFTQKGVEPKAVAHLDGYQRDPNQAWAFHEHMRRLIAKAQPHRGYEVISKLMRIFNAETFLLTSNVDELHLRSDVPRERFWARYGSLWELMCVTPCKNVWWRDEREVTTDINPETMRAKETPRCPFCGGPARPRAQLDHDPHFLPDEVGGARYEAFVSEPVDVYLIIGTTLWFSWPDDVKKPRVIHVNPNPKTHEHYEAPVALTMGAESALLGLEFALGRL